VSGVVHRLRGTYELKKLGGLYFLYPGVAVLFLVPALSLAGIPPLSGFFAKFSLVRAGLESEQYWIVAAALGVSLLTLFSMIKIWNEAFWKADPKVASESSGSEPEAEAIRRGKGSQWGMLVPIGLLALITVCIGLAAQPVFDLALGAAEQLMNPEVYIQAVLGGRT
jgi:multicomponent Na+:H+ antiporter subunit D